MSYVGTNVKESKVCKFFLQTFSVCSCLNQKLLSPHIKKRQLLLKNEVHTGFEIEAQTSRL